MSRIDYALKIIDKLMSEPLKTADNKKRIDLMFMIIELEAYPPVFIKPTGVDEVLK